MASREAFAAACIKLYSRLWAHLELWAAREEHEPPDRASTGDDVNAEILRLEIHLLLNACDSAHWRLLLSAPQRLALKSVLKDVLLAFDAETVQVPREALGAAQNRLLDAVRAHCATSRSTSVLELERLRRAGW